MKECSRGWKDWLGCLYAESEKNSTKLFCSGDHGCKTGLWSNKEVNYE